MNKVDARELGQKLLHHLRSIAASGGAVAGKSRSPAKIAACRANWLKAQAALKLKHSQTKPKP